MELVPKLPPISLRGPRPMPLLGATGNVLAFFRDPVGVLLRLHRTYGNVAPFVDRNPAWVAVFGAEHNQAVLSDAKRFHNFADIPLRLPEGSAPLRLNDALTSMNGEVHRRHRRLLMPAFSRPAIASYRDGMVSVARRLLEQWPASGTFCAVPLCTEGSKRRRLLVLSLFRNPRVVASLIETTASHLRQVSECDESPPRDRGPPEGHDREWAGVQGLVTALPHPHQPCWQSLQSGNPPGTARGSA